MTGVTALYDRGMSLLLPPTRTRTLAETLTRELEDPIMDATSGHVVDLQTGQTVFGLRQDVPRHMASTTKLFTAGALLTHVGPETTFTTTLLTEQPPAADGVLAGDLIVVGGGDPLLGDDDFLRTGYKGRGTRISRLVDVVTGAGITRIRGSVVGDGSLFSRTEDPAPSITALSFNQSTDERPVLFAARRISEALESAGVVVEGRPAGRRTTATGLHELGTVASLPLLDLLTVGLYESDNVIIATAAKRMSAIDGKRGSSNRSARMIERFAADHGARIDITTPTGLLEGNQCTPEAITTYLVALDRSPLWPTFKRILPRAGADGTLTYRMRNTRAAETVQAKSGTLTLETTVDGRRVRRPLQDSLAGYCRGRRRSAVFSFVLERAQNRAAARNANDRMAQAVAEYCG